MIIHHKEDFKQYKIFLCKSLKYSESFTFVPIMVRKEKFNKCIFQTPLLFTPFGIQETTNHKKIIDLSFQNKPYFNPLFTVVVPIPAFECIDLSRIILFAL